MTLWEDTYGFEYSFGGEGFATFLSVVYLIYMLIVFAVGVAQYVLQSAGFYAISKRRDIRHPWLSWIPLGNLWILGCISDQYRYVTKGKVKNKRKWLLALSVLPSAMGTIGVVSFFVSVLKLMMKNGMQELAPEQMLPAVLSFLGVMLVVACLSLALAVLQYVALYDLYNSTDPKNSALFLILSIFVGITMPLLIFLSRKKDLGMPPRKTEPVEEPWQAAEQSQEPWENNR